MGSWVRSIIISPLRKACSTLFPASPRDRSESRPGGGGGGGGGGLRERNGMELHGEVMACAYEDVRVMWSILDKSRSS